MADVNGRSRKERDENEKAGIMDGGDNHTNASQVDEQEFCKFRLSEVYLMKAEAQASSGKDGDAKATLNELLRARTRAGKTALTCDTYPSMKGLSALDMVKLQWRIEMWGENGLNYYCHKRWNEPSTRTGSNHWNTTSWSVDDMEWKIPMRELQTNSYWER